MFHPATWPFPRSITIRRHFSCNHKSRFAWSFNLYDLLGEETMIPVSFFASLRLDFSRNHELLFEFLQFFSYDFFSFLRLHFSAIMRIRVKRLDELLNISNYYEALISMNNKSGESNLLKMAAQSHRNTPDLVTQKLGEE